MERRSDAGGHDGDDGILRRRAVPRRPVDQHRNLRNFLQGWRHPLDPDAPTFEELYLCWVAIGCMNEMLADLDELHEAYEAAGRLPFTFPELLAFVQADLEEAYEIVDRAPKPWVDDPPR